MSKNVISSLLTMLREAEAELLKSGGSPSRVLAMTVLQTLARASNSRMAKKDDDWSINDQLAWRMATGSISFWLAIIGDEVESPVTRVLTREKSAKDSGHEGEDKDDEQEEERALGVEESSKRRRRCRSRRRKGCWQCGSTDHTRELCANPKTYDYCYRCGNKGYRSNTCPNIVCIEKYTRESGLAK